MRAVAIILGLTRKGYTITAQPSWLGFSFAQKQHGASQRKTSCHQRKVTCCRGAVLKSRYLAAAENKDKVDFFDLPAQAQTVIASVSFQYGSLETKAPSFWKAVASQSWEESVKVLNKFGDVYTTRRKLEADVLAPLILKPAPTPAAAGTK